MDFRTCPACKASVLEDDATECPFCGASMTTGRPAGKAQAAAVTKQPAKGPAKTSPKPAAEAPKKTPAKTSTSIPMDDTSDPFDVDTSAARTAIPLAPRPAKGKMQRLVCPMCETPGFLAPKDLGKEVRCANPKCLMPVFVAKGPDDDKPKEEEPQEAVGGKMWLYAGLAVLVVAGLGAMFVLKSQKAPTSSGPLVDLSQPRTNQPGVETPDGGEPAKKPPVVEGMSREEMLQKSLAEIRNTAEYMPQGPRRLTFAPRILSEALIETGDGAKARQELNILPPNAKYLAAFPLLIEARQKLVAGDASGATKALDEALAAAKTLPKSGRDAVEITAALASMLVATGRAADARALLDARRDLFAADNNFGQFTILWRGAIESGKFDFETLSRRSCLRDVPNAQWATVTQSLSLLGKWDEALAWALAAPDVAARDACVAVIAANLAAALPDAEAQPHLAKLTAAVEGVGQSRLWTAVGQARLERGDKPGAEQAAQQSAAALDTVAPPAALALPGMAELFRLSSTSDRGLPKTAPMQSAILASADLVELRLLLGQTTEALQSLERGLSYAPAIAPNVDAVQKLVTQNKDITRAREALAKALGIDAVRAVPQFSQYSVQVGEWFKAAETRRTLEVMLLERAARGGQMEKVWEIAQTRVKSTDPATHQAFLTSTLPGALWSLSPANSALAKSIREALGGSAPPTNEVDRALGVVGRLATSMDWQQLLPGFQRYYKTPTAERHKVDIALIAAVLDQRDRDPRGTIAFLSQLNEPLICEDALWMLAARLVLDGRASDFLKTFDFRTSKDTNRLAICRGIIDGVMSGKWRPAAAGAGSTSK